MNIRLISNGFSEWGMAASKEENDYCHQLQKLLCAEHPGTVVTPLNIAYWERNLTCDIDSLIGSAVRGEDLVVIRLGENVQDKQAFRSGILRLVEYCKQKAGRVVITGCFLGRCREGACHYSCRPYPRYFLYSD